MKNEKLRRIRPLHFLISHLLFFIFHFSPVASAQLAIVNDPDGYTNVREGKGLNYKILGRFTEDDVFMCDAGEDEQWRGIWDSTLTGFVHNTRLRPIDQLPHIPTDSAHRTLREEELIIHNDSIQFQIITTTGQKQIAEFFLQIGNKRVSIPSAMWTDLYEPGIKSLNIYFYKGRIYLYMPYNSHGYSAYAVAWIIKNGKFLKRYVDAL